MIFFMKEYIVLGGGDTHYREPQNSQMVNRYPKLVKLHIGHLIGPNVVAWYDFSHTKNFTP